MKTRHQRTPLVLHPLSLAALVALAGPAFALPTGGVVVGGQATIARPNPTTQVVTQGSNKAIIDWTSFSIASGERVRFDQPSSSAVILNRVTGYDPSKIFGSLESNGRVFLLNPYGVVFGASARVDVGGLMASTLSLSNADFNAGRLRLTSNDGSGLAVRGEVRNEGVISAPGGTVVLAGPSVSNTGTIDARGGRVGMAAVQDVLVDVEGDGLIFFQASATEASNRLAQLGRIQADGGSVELRALARGAFADTVLNLGGVVQARAIGVKQGRVVIDGGDAGITRVAGAVDASGAGAGERGGNISVRGEKVLLDLAAVLDASGHVGGGKVTVGGDWQGQGAGADLGANAAMTHVASGARIDVSGGRSGNGGTAVVWADDATRFYGAIDARGGASAGDGGKVEVSGKRYLDFAGAAQIGATQGRAGELLLDPADITISAAADSGNMSPGSPFEATSGTSSNLSVTTLNTLLAGGGLVRVNSGGAGTAGNGETGSITLAAGAAINGTGAASLRLESNGAVALNSAVTLSGGGSFSVTGEGGAGRAGSFTSDTGVTISTTPTAAGVNAGNVSIATNGSITLGGAITTAATASSTVAGGHGGNVTLSSADGSILARAITTSGANADANTGAIANRRGGNAGNVTIEVPGSATADRTIDVQGAITAAGGRGGDGLDSGNNAGLGGNAGAVSITNGRGSVATLGISAHGGDGGDGRAGFDNNNDDGGNGGSGGGGGAITLTSTGAGFDATVGGALGARGGNGGDGGVGGAGLGNGGNGADGGAGGTVQVTAGARVLLGASTVNTGGGAGGTLGSDGGGGGNNGTAGVGGANAGITLSAGTDFSVTSTLDTTGGSGNAAIALAFGQAGGGATLDLGTPGQLSAGSLNVSGGAGSDSLLVTLPGGAASLTLSDAALTLTGLPSATLALVDAATISGGSGSNMVHVAAFTGTATVNASAGTDTITGNGANTSFVGPSSGNYEISGARAGSVGDTSFTEVGRIDAGSGDDTFTLGAGVASFNGTLNGGGGTNALTLTDGANAVAVTGANAGTLNTTTAFSGIGTVNGGSGAETYTLGAGVTTFAGTLAGGGGANALTLTDGTNTIVVGAANAGSVNGTTAFSGIGALTGGSGADSVTLGPGVTSFAGSIDGGAGANALAVTNGSNAYVVTGDASGTLNTTTTFSNIGSLAGGSGADSLTAISDVATTTLTGSSLARSGLATLTLSGIETATLGGGAGANAIDASGFAGSTTVLASAGADSVAGNGSATRLAGTANASGWAISAANAGTLTEGANTTTFTGITRLDGGGAADVFTLNAGVASFNGTLAGGGGSNTLALTDGTNTIAISGLNGGTLNGSTSFTSITTLGGGSGNDTLAAATGGTAFVIGSTNAASAAGMAATGIETLAGGAGDDSFSLGAGVATFNGSISGGGGTNTLTLTDGANAIAISGANAGTLNTTTAFSSVTTVNGGSGAETYTLGAGVTSFNGTLAGGGGSNTLALTDGTNTVAISGANAGTLNGGTAFTGIATLSGGTGNDTLAAAPGGTAFVIGGANAAGAAGIAATSIEALSGGAGNDSFTLAGGVASFNGSIGGGGGANTLTLTDGTNAIAVTGANAGSVNTTTSFTGIGTLNGGSGADTYTLGAGITSFNGTLAGGGGSNTLALTDGTNTITISGANAGTLNGSTSFTGIATLSGGAGNNTLAATNGANTFAVNGANSGTLNATTSYTNIGNLAGGSGADDFVIGAAGTLTGTLDGGAGSNTLDLSAKTGALVVDQSGSVTENGSAVLAGFSNIGALAGNGTATELIGSSAGQTFTLAGNLAGSAGSLGFSGVTRLTGAGANDTLVVADDVGTITLTNASIARAGFATMAIGGFESATLGGGAGSNTIDAGGFGGSASILASAGGDLVVGNGAGTTLAGTATGSTFTVSGNDSGSLFDGINLTTFNGVGNLAGGAGNDSFAIQNAGTLSGGINGGAGGNTLDLSNKTSATIVFNQGSSTISGVGVAGAITNVGTTIGNGLNTTLQGSNAGQSFAITAINQITVDGAQVFQGVGNLNAGTGADSISGSSFRLDGNIVDAGGATTLSGTIVTFGSQNYAGPVTAGAPLTLAALGTISATHAGNDFGTLSLATAGAGGVDIVDANNLTLGTVSLAGSGANSIAVGSAVGSTLSRTTALSAANTPTLTVGGVLVNTGVNTLFASGAASSVQIQAGVGGTHDLSAAGVSVLPGLAVSGNLAVSSAGNVTQSGALTVGGTTSINAGAGSITLAAANDFQGAVSLTGGATQITDANALTLGTLATGALSATATGALGLGQGSVGGALVAASNGGAVSQSGALSVAGTSSVNAGAGAITLAAANDFQGAVSLTGGTTQIADTNALTLGTLATGALSATSTGALGLGQGSVGGALVATSNGGAVSQGGALSVAGTSSVNAGTGAITLAAANDFQGAVSLTGGATQITDANALTLGAVSLAAGQSFTATGSTLTLTNGVTTTADQTYAGSVALGADVALSAGAGRIHLQGSIDGAGNDLTLASSNAAADAIRIGGAVGNVAQFVANGRSTLGANLTTTGSQTFAGTLTLGGDAVLDAGAATISLQGVDGGTRNLTLTSSGAAADAISVAGAVANAASLTTNGRTRLAGNVTTTGTQAYNGSVLLGGDVALTGSTLTFGGSVDGAHALAVNNGSGATAVFNAAVGDSSALTSLSVSGPARLNGSRITTTGGQSYADAVTLGSNTTLAGNSVSFLGTVDGAHALAVQNPGTTTFAGAVGTASPLAALAVQGGGTVALSAASVETSGAQDYSGALQVAGSTRLTGGSLSFGAGVSGAQDLTLQADALSVTGALAGTGTLTIAPRTASRSIGLAGAAGDLAISQALLTSAGGFAQQVIGRADGSGDVASNALQLATNTTLQSGSGDIRLNGSVDGGFDLALNTGGLTHLAGPIGTTGALRSLTTDNHTGAADWDGTSGERTLIDGVDASGRARVITSGAQTYNDPLIVLVPVQFAGGAVSATHAASRFDAAVHAGAASLELRSAQAITLGDVTLANGGRVETDGVLELAGALVLDGGTLSLVTHATPSALADFTDPELQGRALTFGLAPVSEASATLLQSAGSTLSSSAGSLLVLRSTNGGSMALENPGNNLRGGLSAVSGPLGDNSVTRFTTLPLGFIRISSTEINAAGAPPADGSQTLLQAGIEADVLKLSADRITTGPNGQLRARLPFDNSQGSATSVPGLTLIMSPTALTIGGGFGLSTPDGYIQVRVGSELGGFLTVRPRGVSGDNAFILLAGPDPKPFYDGNGKLTEVRVFYNGDAPRTPQEAGALTAVTAIVEDARQTRFEEAVRTENVKSRLRSGVIAEVGAGRPATVGRESILMPQNCTPKPASLQCE